MLARQAATFGQIVAFELRYHLRQPSTYVYFVIFGLLGWLVAIGDIKSATARVTLNAPVTVAMVDVCSLSIFGLFIPLAILAHAALRDQRTKMDELIRAAPVASGTYLLGRFAGAFIITVARILRRARRLGGRNEDVVDRSRRRRQLSIRRLSQRAGDHRAAEPVFCRRVILHGRQP